MLKQETVRIPEAEYIYRVTHRIMEGDCQMDHGPRLVKVGPLEADVYCVTNAMYQKFLEESGYKPKDDAGFLRHWESGRCPEGSEDLPVVYVS